MIASIDAVVKKFLKDRVDKKIDKALHEIIDHGSSPAIQNKGLGKYRTAGEKKSDWSKKQL